MNDKTNIPKMPDVNEALREAVENIRNAEKFFDANVMDKAYAAAFIAEKWTGIANTLHIREQMALWNKSAPIDPPAPPHTHAVECVHDWSRADSPETGEPWCRNKCGVPFSYEVRRSFCPAVCPDGKRDA